MLFRRMPIEIESPEQSGYGNIDCNLAESSVTDVVFKDLKLDLCHLVLAYGDHLGKPELRQLLAAEHSGIGAEDVLMTAGAAAALFIVASTLLQAGDHIVVAHPNYATNIETPRAIGCSINLLPLFMEDGFTVNPARLRALIKPRTRLVSLTSPHNPTGTVMDRKVLEELVELAERNGFYLLLDETYRDLCFTANIPLAASLSPRVISVSSLSKAMGLPGIRIGWIINKNRKLMETFLAAKEQICICNSVVDEEIAYQFLLQKHAFQPAREAHIQRNFSLLKKWMEQETRLEWIEPRGGVVCFPRFTRKVDVDVPRFYKFLQEKYKTLVGPGHWFEVDKRYMRIGFGWPSLQELEKGLKNISKAINDSMVQ